MRRSSHVNMNGYLSLCCSAGRCQACKGKEWDCHHNCHNAAASAMRHPAAMPQAGEPQAHRPGDVSELPRRELPTVTLGKSLREGCSEPPRGGVVHRGAGSTS